MIGFSVRVDNIASIQIACDNDYGVTLMAYKPSDDPRCMFSTCAIDIAKVAPTAKTFVNDNGEVEYSVEDKTLEVMKKMDYQPTEKEIEEGLFLDVNLSKFFEIVAFVEKLEVH